jgi:hypothetical protein
MTATIVPAESSRTVFSYSAPIAVKDNDLMVIMGTVLITVILICLINLIADRTVTISAVGCLFASVWLRRGAG